MVLKQSEVPVGGDDETANPAAILKEAKHTGVPAPFPKRGGTLKPPWL